MTKFNLYNDKREIVVKVTKYDADFHVMRGVQGTQLEFVNRNANTAEEYAEFVNTYDLKTEEELGQLTLDDLFKEG